MIQGMTRVVSQVHQVLVSLVVSVTMHAWTRSLLLKALMSLVNQRTTRPVANVNVLLVAIQQRVSKDIHLILMMITFMPVRVSPSPTVMMMLSS